MFTMRDLSVPMFAPCWKVTENVLWGGFVSLTVWEADVQALSEVGPDGGTWLLWVGCGFGGSAGGRMVVEDERELLGSGAFFVVNMAWIGFRWKDMEKVGDSNAVFRAFRTCASVACCWDS